MKLILISTFILVSVVGASLEGDEGSVQLEDDSKLLVKRIEGGLIKGRVLTTPRGTKGVVFLSVPVAAPPVDSLRFKKPIPRAPWDGVVNTVDYTVSCWWNSTVTNRSSSEYKMDEDCIQLNIFTNRHCLSSRHCPVVFYIHGGQFTHGTPMIFDKNSIVDNFVNSSRNVVFVTATFRQNAFGILNLNHNLDLSMDTNVGFYDLIFEMQWIQRNIHVFGGDSAKVTLMSHSGGTEPTAYLTVSPLTQNLYSQFVLMSGTPADLGLMYDRNQKASRLLAKNTKCVDFDVYDPKWDKVQIVEAAIKCLRQLPAPEISRWLKEKETEGFGFQALARDYEALPGQYLDLEKDRKNANLLMGCVKKEFLNSAECVTGAFTVDPQRLNMWCEKTIKMMNYPVCEKSMAACVEEYNSPSRVMDMYDDFAFYGKMNRLATQVVQNNGTVYMYQFEYPDIGPAFSKNPGAALVIPEKSPAHSMELIYLLGEHMGNFTAKDYEIQYLYSQIFIDFVHYRTPSVNGRNWEKYDPKNKNYFLIDYPDPKLNEPGNRWHFREQTYLFWYQKMHQMFGDMTPLESEEDIVPGMLYTAQYLNSSDKSAGATPWKMLFYIVLGTTVALVAIQSIYHLKNAKKQRYEPL